MNLKWKKSKDSQISLFERHIELESKKGTFRIPLEQIEKIQIPKNLLFNFFAYLKLEVDADTYNSYMQYLGKNTNSKSNKNLKFGVKNPPEEVLDFIDNMRDNKAKTGTERMIEETVARGV